MSYANFWIDSAAASLENAQASGALTPVERVELEELARRARALAQALVGACDSGGERSGPSGGSEPASTS